MNYRLLTRLLRQAQVADQSKRYALGDYIHEIIKRMAADFDKHISPSLIADINSIAEESPSDSMSVPNIPGDVWDWEDEDEAAYYTPAEEEFATLLNRNKDHVWGLYQKYLVRAHQELLADVNKSLYYHYIVAWNAKDNKITAYRLTNGWKNNDPTLVILATLYYDPAAEQTMYHEPIVNYFV